MTKHITGLGTDPHTVQLADRPCSLFLDPLTAQIFLDEGGGQDRINGAVLSPDRQPVFAVADDALVVDYAGRRITLGHLAGLDATRWVASANAVISSVALQPHA